MMEENFPLLPLQMQINTAIQNLDTYNAISSQFNLSLTRQQVSRLIERRFQALKSTGRIEFGEGILKKLIIAFCDSPYITQKNYEEILGELQDIFYYFKNESGDTLSDDELIEAMNIVFDGRAQGSLEYLSGTALKNLCRMIRGGNLDEDEASQCEENYET